MSIKAINWAFKQVTKSPAEKLLLLALADFANNQHECWPNRSTLIPMLSLHSNEKASLNSVSRSLKSLQSQGLILIESQKLKTGRGTSNKYVLLVEVPPHPRGGVPRTHEGVLRTHEGVSPAPARGSLH